MLTRLAGLAPRNSGSSGPVSILATLTFHFWSGATVTYHVTKAGTSLTGTPA